MKDVHTEHCCIRHGCKYCDEDCTVVSGEKEQSFTCEACDWEMEDPQFMRIKQLEEALQKLYLASGPVANCAYNVGQQHEDWNNIYHYVSELDKVRTEAIKVYRGE